MSALDDIYLDYYDAESLSSKWRLEPHLQSSRRITLSLPDAIKVLSSGGPTNYDPATMTHTERELFNQKPLYAAPLAYYALKVLKPWCFEIDTGDQLLSSQLSVSTVEGEERVNLGDIIAPWAKKDISRLDPATWAFLIRNYHGLPEHYSRYRLALDDPHLSALSAIPSTSRFSIITVLDLSACLELHDGNISQLKLLTSLCVLDTSRTYLTDQGVKNLKSTLLLREPGPMHLRSWSLRGCPGITNQVFESLAVFPLLCLLDLRDSSVKPRRISEALRWDKTSLLPVRDHLDYFWPEPQHRIPALLQKLEHATFLHSMKCADPNGQPQEPYVIHVERPSTSTERPVYWGSSRKANIMYSINRSPSPLYDEYGGSDYGYDAVTAWDGFEGDSEEDSASESYTSDIEIVDTTSAQHVNASSPLEPTSSTFSDYDEPSLSQQGSTSSETEEESKGSYIDTQRQDSPSSPAPSSPHRATSPQDSHIESSDLLAYLIAQESIGSAPGVPHFYNARAQAGLAPPKKRKRRKVYSSASSESYDSDEEREARHKLRIESLSEVDQMLMLLRKPPPWSIEALAAVLPQKPPSYSQAKPTHSVLAIAKKRKLDASGATGLWAQIKAANKMPGKSSEQFSTSVAPSSTDTTRRKLARQIQSTPAQAPATTQRNDPPVRRTPFGRAPRPPGTIIRKLH